MRFWVPETVIVPAVPPKAALVESQATAFAPLNQLAVELSQVPEPPVPVGPQFSWAWADGENTTAAKERIAVANILFWIMVKINMSI